MHINSTYDLDIATIKNTETLLLEYMRRDDCWMQEVCPQEFRRRLEQKRQRIEAKKTLEKWWINKVTRDNIYSYYSNWLKLWVWDIAQKTATTFGVVESIVYCVVKIHNRNNKVAIKKKSI